MSTYFRWSLGYFSNSSNDNMLNLSDIVNNCLRTLKDLNYDAQIIENARSHTKICPNLIEIKIGSIYCTVYVLPNVKQIKNIKYNNDECLVDKCDIKYELDVLYSGGVNKVKFAITKHFDQIIEELDRIKK